MVLNLEKENRIFTLSEGTFNAFNTCEPAFAPLLQALPPDTQIPSKSSENSNKGFLDLRLMAAI